MSKKVFALIFFLCAVLVGFSKIAHADFSQDHFNALDCKMWDCSRLPCPLDAPCSEYKWVDRHKTQPRRISFNRSSATIVSEINGNSFLRLTSAPKDPQVFEGTKRTEIADRMRVADGGTSWYRVRLRIPEDFVPPEKKTCVFMQVHDQDQNKDRTPDGLKHKPPVAFRVNSEGKAYVTFDRVDPKTGKDAADGNNGVREKFNLPTLKKGEWVDIAMKIQWGDPGSAQIFINGQLAVSYPDPMCTGPMCTRPMGNRPMLEGRATPGSVNPEPPTVIQQGNYLKLGPYCGDNQISQNYSVDVDHFSRDSGENCPSFFSDLCRNVSSRGPAAVPPAPSAPSGPSAPPAQPAPNGLGVK